MLDFGDISWGKFVMSLSGYLFMTNPVVVYNVGLEIVQGSCLGPCHLTGILVGVVL